MSEEGDMESQIKLAMTSRVSYFHEQADSLTFEGVRRLLEKDLGLEKYALDVHKRYIKQLLSKYLEGNDDENVTRNLEETTEKNIPSTMEMANSPEINQADKDVKEPEIEDEEQVDDSPVMGLLTENESIKTGAVETEGVQKNEIPSESIIKEALRKRAAYFKANSEEISMVGVRRLLEKDLELDEFTLDPIKKLIREQVDKVLSSKTSTLSSGDKKKTTQRKTSKKIGSERSSDSSDKDSDDMEEVKPRKKVVGKAKIQTSKGLKKRKRPEKDTTVPSKKKNRLAKMTSEEMSGDDGNDSEDGHSQSSEEKPVKKKEVSTPAYGKKVEHLKSVIKSCGMSVAPVIYKKAKQVPDSKREAFIINELEKILEKEGLSKNPTEKEIKEAKRRKERAKELEGIDTSNIVLSARRRSATSFIPPPKPKTPVESDGDDTDDGNDDDNSDDSNSEDDGGDNDVEEHDESQNDEPPEDEDSD